MARVRRRLAAALATLLIATAVGEQAPAATTRLTVAGNVAHPLTLTVDDLRRYPARAIEYSARGGMAPATPVEPPRRYTGCLLRDVLNAAKPTEAAPRDLRRSYVVASASDGYEVVFSWAELYVSPAGEDVFVVYERDGAPLPEDEGRIALIARSDLRPARHVKWLRALTLRVAGPG